MAMRIGWIESEMSGRETKLSGGVRSKDGYMNTKYSQRENGESKGVLRIYTEMISSTKIRTTVHNLVTNEVWKIDTDY